MGYRLTLDHCPVHIDERSYEWRGLFSGLQIIDLEHASLHLSCPIVPKAAPLPSLRQLQTVAKDPYHSLTQMMHTGLSHFTGRGLPTIWSFISEDQNVSTAWSPAVFTEADSKVIREWARRLDEWLVLWNKPQDPDNDTLMIFRQYSLHRLFVLSIYHPARGFDLFANNVATIERHELLISARATLKLQNEDKGIWSNWDLMITWAALLVLQGIEGGVGEPDDFIPIQTHLNMLQITHQPEPSLRHTLASRLESSLQNMHTPRPAPEPPFHAPIQPQSHLQQPSRDQDQNHSQHHGQIHNHSHIPTSTSISGYEDTWTIFDSNSIALAASQFPPSSSEYVMDTVGRNIGGVVGLQNSNGSADTAGTLGTVRHFGDIDAPWWSSEQYADAWQSTMFKIFGNGFTDGSS